MNAPTADLGLGRAFTTKQAAAFLGISVNRIYYLMNQRRIRFLKASGLVIYEAWCREFIERYSQPPVEDVQQVHEALAQTAQQGPTGIEDLLHDLPKRRFG